MPNFIIPSANYLGNLNQYWQHVNKITRNTSQWKFCTLNMSSANFRSFGSDRCVLTYRNFNKMADIVYGVNRLQWVDDATSRHRSWWWCVQDIIYLLTEGRPLLYICGMFTGRTYANLLGYSVYPRLTIETSVTLWMKYTMFHLRY